MHKIIISGGPSTGKSTTFEMLKEEYPEAHFVPEPAELVIRRELGKQKHDPNYDPILPTFHYPAFSRLNLDQSERLEADVPENSALTFYDRSVLDDKGYGRHYGFEEYIPEIDDRFKAIGFKAVFFCESLNIFERNEIRKETEQEGRRIHRRLREVYEESGLEMITLPPVSKEERLEIIRRTVANFKCCSNTVA
jgi:predicted ATPase